MALRSPGVGYYRHWKYGEIVEVEAEVFCANSKRPGIVYRYITGPRRGRREWRSVAEWNSPPAGSSAAPVRFQPISSNLILLQDPLTLVLEAFSGVYPDAPVRVCWVEDQDVPGACYYYTDEPMVGLRTDLTIAQAVYVLIHELAHVVTGHEEEAHGDEWERAEAQLMSEYTQRVAAYKAVVSLSNPGIDQFKKGKYEQNNPSPSQIGGEI